MVDYTLLMRGLLSAVTALDELPHPRPAGRLLLAAALAGKGANDDAVASLASMRLKPLKENWRLHIARRYGPVTV